MIRARAIAALDFLERYAGHDSQWAIRGHEVFDKDPHSEASGARALGDVLREWTASVQMIGRLPVNHSGARPGKARGDCPLSRRPVVGRRYAKFRTMMAD